MAIGDSSYDPSGRPDHQGMDIEFIRSFLFVSFRLDARVILVGAVAFFNLFLCAFFRYGLKFFGFLTRTMSHDTSPFVICMLTR